MRLNGRRLFCGCEVVPKGYNRGLGGLHKLCRRHLGQSLKESVNYVEGFAVAHINKHLPQEPSSLYLKRRMNWYGR